MSRYIFIHGSINGEDCYIPDNVPEEIKEFMLDLKRTYFTQRDFRIEKLKVAKDKISKALLIRPYKGFICYTYFVDNLISNGESRNGQCFCITILSKNECLCCDHLYTFFDKLFIAPKLITGKILRDRTYIITTFAEAREQLDSAIEIINNNIDNNSIGMFVKDVSNLNSSYEKDEEVLYFKDVAMFWDKIFEGYEIYLTDTVPSIVDKNKVLEQENIKLELKKDNSQKSSQEIANMQQQLKKVIKEKEREKERLTEIITQLENRINELEGSLGKNVDNIRSVLDSMENVFKFGIGKTIKEIKGTPEELNKEKGLGQRVLIILQMVLIFVVLLLQIAFFFGSKTNNISYTETDKIYGKETTQQSQDITEYNESLRRKVDSLKEEISNKDEELQKMKTDVTWLQDSVSHITKGLTSEVLNKKKVEQ